MAVSWLDNPWIAICFRPRVTLRRILEENPTRFVLVLAALGGVLEFLREAEGTESEETSLASIFVRALTVGALMGILGLYVFGFVLRGAGSLLGGRGTARDVRAALAWAYVPAVWLAILWIPKLLLFGKSVFTIEAESLGESYLALRWLEYAGSLWSLVIGIQCLGEALRLSAWKALLALLMGTLLLAVPLLAILIASALLST